MGYLREIVICDAIMLALRDKGRASRHIHFVDDLDGFRKVPAGLPPEYEKYLGKPLCDMPSPDGSANSYADYALGSFLDSVTKLGIEIDVIRSHQKYRAGFFGPAIEETLKNLPTVRSVLEKVSGRKLEKDWAPIQVNEEGYLKNRRFVSINTADKTLKYLDASGAEQVTGYETGQVKLNWRLDWPARWWLLKVNVEPSGRDHSTKGGSYDTGVALMKEVFKAPEPLGVAYNFINRAGETKKMSASSGDGILISEVVEVLPPEVARYFILRSSPDKLLTFDPQAGVVRLIDEYAELLAKPNKSESDTQLINLASHGVEETVSKVPFSHLVSSYQAALKNSQLTLDIIKRTETEPINEQQETIIKNQLRFTENWLKHWAPEDVKFELAKEPSGDFSDSEKDYFSKLAKTIENAPESADGEWFHKAIYSLKESGEVSEELLFKPLYKLLIDKPQGPRAGWFLSILPRDWLIKRLKLES